jgi:uncharacterized protein YfaS (alpha-2-macroglobulin family)
MSKTSEKKEKVEKKYPNILRNIFAILALSIGAFILLIFSFLLNPPPIVVGIDQINILREISSNGIIELRFSGKMNQRSVEEALSIKPDIEGRVLWKKDDVMQFIPKDALPFQENITLTLTTAAKDTWGKNLQEEVVLRYVVISPPEVTMISPISSHDWEGALRKREGSDENILSEPALLKRGQPITVMFDRPMKILRSDEENEGNEENDILDYLIFEPEQKGTVRWLGTSTFEFYIDQQTWPESQMIHATLKSGLSDISGGTTTEEISWSFKTQSPQLISVQVGEDFLDVEKNTFSGKDILPNSKITLEWNIPVDLESFFQHFSLTPDRTVKNDLIIQDQENKNIIHMNFDPPLVRNETIHLSLSSEIKPLRGEIPSELPYDISFSTLPNTCLQLKNPEEILQKGILPNGSIIIDFCSFMQQWSEGEGKEKDVSELVRKHLILSPHISLEEDDISCFGRECSLQIPSKPGEDFDISFSEGLADIFGQAIPVQGFSAHIVVRDYAPLLSSLNRNRSQGLYDRDAPLGAFFSARNVSHIDVITCEVPEEHVRKNEGKGGAWFDFSCKENGKNIQEHSQEVPGEKNTMTLFEVPIGEEHDRNAVIFWEVSSPQVKNPWNDEIRKFRGAAFSANASLITKWNDASIMVWATAFDTGNPIPHFPITFYDNNGELFAQGKTNDKGILIIDRRGKQFDFFVEGRSDTYTTFVGSQWNQGISPWDFDISQSWKTGLQVIGAIITDRPIYRPGDTVHFKGIFREDRDASLSPPSKKKTVYVQIQNSRGEYVLEKEFSLSKFGTFSEDFSIPEETPTGMFTFTAKETKDEYSFIAHSVFWVEEYKKPVFKIDFTSRDKEFVSQDDFFVNVQTRYFFGTPVKNAEIFWNIVQSPLYFDRWSGGGWFSFGSDESCYTAWCSESEDIQHSGVGKTDENGNFSISFPLSAPSHSLYTLQVTAVNSSKQSVSSRKTFPVFSGEFVLGVRNLDFWLDESKKTITAKVLAADLDGEAITGKKFLAKLQQVSWNSIKKEDVDGNDYWENTREVVDLEVISGITKVGGKTEITFSLKDTEEYFGQLQITVESEDRKGNTISASDTFWRSSILYFSPWKQENNDRIDLHTEKTDVSPGDSLEIIPASPFLEKVSALITVERKNILHQKVVSLLPGEILSLEVTEEMVPNAFISVILFKGKGILGKVHQEMNRFQEIEERLQELDGERDTIEQKEKNILKKLDGAQEELSLALQKGLDLLREQRREQEREKQELESEQKILKVQIALETGEEKAFQNPKSNPPQPEMKMGMIPLRVSAEKKRIEIDIFPEKQKYLPGETVRLLLKAEDSLGQPIENADLSIAVVDESLLALKSRQKENIFDIFFAVRRLGVKTSASLTHFIDRIDIASLKGAKGGGGGGGDDTELLKKKRGDFRDTAFWKADLQTNQNGEVDIEFSLPDNATTWQVWVTANTTDSHFGSKKMNFLSQKPLLLTPLFPRFFLVGDKATIGVSIHNQMGSELILDIKAEAENASISGQDFKNFRLSEGGKKDVFFPIEIFGAEETVQGTFHPAQFTFIAQSDKKEGTDTLQVSIPILPPAIGETLALSGHLGQNSSSRTEEIIFPAGALRNIGNVFISLTPGVTGNITNGLSSLIQFPYGCSEQIMSTYLPNLAIFSLEKEIGRSLVDIDTEVVENIVETGAYKLYQLQKTDGGFGFWKGSNKSYPYLTAYVLFGLEMAKEYGYPVDENILSRARKYIAKKLFEDMKGGDLYVDEEEQASFADADARAFSAFSLSLGETFDESILSHLFQKRADMSAEGNAFLLLTTYKRDAQKTMTSEIIRGLEGMVHQTDRRAFYSASENPWNFSSDIRSTAIVLFALLQVEPEHPLIPKLTEFLRSHKHSSAKYLGGPWGTTQNTAWVLLAFTEIIRQNPPEETDAEIVLNMKNIFRDTLPPYGEEKDIKVPLSQIEMGEINTVDISKQGSEMGYDISLNFFVPVEKIKEKNRGFGIVREYFSLNDSKMESPLTSARKGDLLKGRTTILVPESRFYVGVTIPLPAGLESINFSLETEDQSLKKFVDSCEYQWCPHSTLWRFSHREYRDDHIFLFADYLPAGRYEFQYLTRATTEGVFQHLPAKAEEIYFPEVFGRSSAGMFTIEH